MIKCQRNITNSIVCYGNINTRIRSETNMLKEKKAHTAK